MQLRIIIPSKLTKCLCFNRIFGVYLWILFFFLNQKQQITLEIGNYSKLKEGLFSPFSLREANSLLHSQINHLYQRKEIIPFSKL